MVRYLFSVAFAVLFLFGEICMSANNSSMPLPCIQRERDSLLNFKASLYDPSNMLSSWEGNHCCQWEHITCHDVTAHVVKLDLSFLWALNMDPSLLELEYLSYLDLSGNDFGGSPIPISIGSMRSLTYLSLSRAYFGGRIPSNLGNLTNLTHLDLGYNYDIRANQSLNSNDINWISKLGLLEHLDLSGVNLGGIHNLLQVLNMLPSLLRIYLAGCQVSDSILPLVNHTNIALRLQLLDLSQNNLNYVPSWLSYFQKLKYLDISLNDLHGPFPDVLSNMTSIESLYLSYNKFTFFPSWFGEFNRLVNLDLSFNALVGPLPEAIKNLTSIESLNLHDNKFTTIPSWFWNISSLIWLHLNNNNLQQRLPMSINALENLLILDLGENQLSGNIPSWIANTFPSLQILRMRQNMLTGSIPSQICQLSSLKILDLSHNILEGSIPLCLGNLTGMMLRNSDSNLNISPISEAPTASTAEAPEPEWSKEDVKQIIKGREDDYIKILKLVVNMDLSENKLVGSIPNGITLLNGLHFLNLSYNHLEGEIPEMIGDMKSLESFDVSHNQLSGSIPNSMPSLTSLSHINLAHNNFSGPIPQANQFLTYDSSVYADNPYLCGHELPNKCPGDESIEVTRSRGNEDKDDKKDKVEKVLFYFVVAVGLATGFWGVIGVLLLKKNWRHAYFRWVEDTMDDIYVAVVLKLAKLKKK